MLHHGRGLCGKCYEIARLAGTLDAYPRLHRPYPHTWEDYDELAAQGYSREHAARRLGMTKAALEKALERRPQQTREAS